MSLAVISSLYRSEEHLPKFAAALFGFAKRLSERGVEAHYLPIVNDASPGERAQVEQLAGAMACMRSASSAISALNSAGSRKASMRQAANHCPM